MKSNESTINSNVETSNSSKIIVNPTVPIEELLGSVTTYNNVEGSESKSLQLRTSARVFKKMKLDSANAVVTIPEKKEPIKEEIKAEVKKPFRPLWTTEDKNLFFEALNEYGKDFEAIHLYISSKLKKKGLPESVIKTKDQIRHLYYRTWHKISKHLKFSDDVKKIAQELYGLINYGELRKKITLVSEKNCVKLNELMYRGSVAIRVKGKTIRVRTPMCRALRRLNQLDESHADIKLPTRVNVELQAKDMNSWMHVQELAQNPRVKTALPLQKRLSSLIHYLNERWKSQNALIYDDMLKSVNVIKSEETLLDGNKPIEELILRLSPPTNCNIEIPAINLSEFLTTQSICLSTYMDRISVKVPGEKMWQNMFANFKTSSKGNTRKGGTKKQRNESTCEKVAVPKQQSPTQTDTNENCLPDPDLPPSVNEVITEAVNTILALQNQTFNGTTEEKLEKENKEVKMEVAEEVESKKEQDIERIRSGWTINNCGSISIGDLYLMFGSNSKIVLEYNWEPSLKTETIKVEPEKSSDTNAETNEYDIESIDSNNNLTSMLKKLLSMAKLHYRKNIIKCPCGHVCYNKANCNKNKNLIIKSIKPNERSLDGQETGASNVPAVTNEQTNVTNITAPILFHSEVRKFAPTTLFRRPNSPNDMLRAQLDSIQRLQPRYCNRKGRPRSKQVVVERKLPLLANKADSGRQIVQMNIVSQENKAAPRTIAPKVIEINTDLTTPGDVNQTLVSTEYVDGNVTTVNVGSEIQNFTIISRDKSLEKITIINSSDATHISDNAVTLSRIGSPSNMNNILGMTLASTHDDDLILNDIPENKDDNMPSFAGLLQTAASSPTSPSRILKENENQWLNSEVADYSLSSLLGHLESPAKNQQNITSISGEDSRLCLPQDVDAHLHSLLTENSLDYMAKFADLAAQVTDVKKGT